MSLISTPTNDIYCHDGILLQNLTLEHAHRVGTDAWGRAKEQPVLISVAVSFKQPFSTAANNDALDSSTMHYGQLAKALRGLPRSKNGETVEEFACRIQDGINTLAGKSDLLEVTQVEIRLPKASLLGQGVSFIRAFQPVNSGQSKITRSLLLDSVTVPVLVGVNANERARKQPLLFHVFVTSVKAGSADTFADFEARLVEIAESSSFETLESLAVYTVQRLFDGFMRTNMPGSGIRLRIEKPMAVPFADAPSIEVFRSAAELQMAQASSNDGKATESHGLRIVKPYC